MQRYRVPRGRDRVKRRADYEEVRKFNSIFSFENWWKLGEKENWRLNSRHPHVSGTVEYWQCSNMEGRRHTCPARLRITFDRENRFIEVCRAKDRPHNHQTVVNKLSDNIEEIHDTVQMEPYPMQTAKIIRVTTSGSNIANSIT